MADTSSRRNQRYQCYKIGSNHCRIQIETTHHRRQQINSNNSTAINKTGGQKIHHFT
jgi:hypothetical protein